MSSTKTATEIAEAILRVVKDANGIKDRDVRFTLGKFFNIHLDETEINSHIENLVRAKKLIALEYSLDLTSVRNFLIPAGSSFIIRGQVEKIHRI